MESIQSRRHATPRSTGDKPLHLLKRPQKPVVIPQPRKTAAIRRKLLQQPSIIRAGLLLQADDRPPGSQILKQLRAVSPLPDVCAGKEQQRIGRLHPLSRVPARDHSRRLHNVRHAKSLDILAREIPDEDKANTTPPPVNPPHRFKKQIRPIPLNHRPNVSDNQSLVLLVIPRRMDPPRIHRPAALLAVRARIKPVHHHTDSSPRQSMLRRNGIRHRLRDGHHARRRANRLSFQRLMPLRRPRRRRFITARPQPAIAKVEQQWNRRLAMNG